MNSTRRWDPRSHGRFVVLTLIVLSATTTSLAAQNSPTTAGMIVRYGFGSTARLDDAFGFGLELEAFPSRALVPVVRLDQWDFGVVCVGLGPCPSAVTTVTLGAKYRAVGTTSVAPYGGGDVGYMEWTSNLAGLSVRVRGGVDIGLIRHVGLNVDGAFTRFVKLSETEETMLESHLWGVSVGLTLRL